MLKPFLNLARCVSVIMQITRGVNCIGALFSRIQAARALGLTVTVVRDNPARSCRIWLRIGCAFLQLSVETKGRRDTITDTDCSDLFVTSRKKNDGLKRTLNHLRTDEKNFLTVVLDKNVIEY